MGGVLVGLRWRVLVALLWLTAMVWPVCAGAQTAVDGAIRGVVEDAQGRGVRDAVVRVGDEGSGFSVEVRSGVGGEFVVARVPSGVYRVRVSAVGFEAAAVTGCAVMVGGVAEMTVRLRVAGASSAVTVSAEAEVGDARVVGEGELERLPVDGRRWQAFALLTPEVSAGDGGGALLSFRGAAVTQNSTDVDGGTDMQSFGGVPRGMAAPEDVERELSEAASSGGGYAAGSRRRAGAAYTFSQEAVKEFRVSGQNYTSLYGRAAGGVITTVSKSGGNALHGTGFYLVRGSGLGAANAFSVATRYRDGVVTSGVVKPHDVRQQFGGSVGGPVLRDRLFYFYAVEGQRRGFPAVSSPGDAGFYALTATQRALLANRGVSSTKVNGALNYLDGLTGTVDRREDQTVNFGKVDWAAGEGFWKSRMSVQYNRVRSSAPGGVRSAAVVDRGVASVGSSYARVDAVLGRWLWTPSRRMSNEVRVQYGRDLQYEVAQAPLAQEPAVGPGGYAPEVSIGPAGLVFGTPATLGRHAYPDEGRWQVSDLVTVVRGRHLMQAGFDVSAVQDRIDALNDVEGTFTYDSGTTNGRAGGLVDWITDYTFNVNTYPNGGCPSINAAVHLFCFRSFTQSFGQQSVGFGTQEWAGFVQDDWKVRAGLTVTAGIRYEYELLPLPQQPNAAVDAVFGGRGATSLFAEDRNNFGPRVGVAWEPFGGGRGVVRVGYGVYFGRLPGATVRSALVDTGLMSSATHVRIVPGTVTDCPQVAGQGFGYACAYGSQAPAAVSATTSVTVLDRRFRLPMVQQGSVSVERTLKFGVVGSATYLMNLDRQLPGSVDMNIAPATGTKVFRLQGGVGLAGVRDGDTFAVPVYTQRVSSAFGAVTDVVSNGSASYHAMVLESRRRVRGGLDFRASWTWSKAIDFAQNEGAVPRVNGQFDPFELRYDKGLSPLNHPHKVVVSAVWEPTLVTPRRWLRATANGWMVAPVFVETSGRPYSFNVFGGTRLSGGRESINGAGGAVYLPTVGRNTLRMADTVNLDLRVSRRVKLTEKVRVRGLAEIYNVANRVNYSGVNQRAFLVGTAGSGSAGSGVTPLVFQDAAAVAAEGLNTRAFGAYTSAATERARERQVQVGVRVEF